MYLTPAQILMRARVTGKSVAEIAASVSVPSYGVPGDRSDPEHCKRCGTRGVLVRARVGAHWQVKRICPAPVCRGRTTDGGGRWLSRTESGDPMQYPEAEDSKERGFRIFGHTTSSAPWVAHEYRMDERRIGDDFIIWYIDQDAGCAACKSTADGMLEHHHFAPRALFGSAADKWPTAMLCKPCHTAWHRRVWPYGAENINKLFSEIPAPEPPGPPKPKPPEGSAASWFWGLGEATYSSPSCHVCAAPDADMLFHPFEDDSEPNVPVCSACALKWTDTVPVRWAVPA